MRLRRMECVEVVASIAEARVGRPVYGLEVVGSAGEVARDVGLEGLVVSEWFVSDCFPSNTSGWWQKL